jgi:hypothetical protein
MRAPSFLSYSFTLFPANRFAALYVCDAALVVPNTTLLAPLHAPGSAPPYAAVIFSVSSMSIAAARRSGACARLTGFGAAGSSGFTQKG